MKFNLKILTILGAIFVILNLIILDVLYLKFKKETAVSPPSVSEPFVTPGETVYQDRCGDDCQRKISEEVSRAIATISGEKEITAQPTPQPTPQPQTVYIPLGSGGSTTNRDWTDLSGSKFIFDLADYPAKAEVHWQGNLKVKDLNSRCYARIYDSDNLRAVDFSEQSTDKTVFETLTSSRLIIWAGKNHYKLQIKSLNGPVCSLESPKLIIISK